MKVKNGRHITDYKGDLYHRHYCRDAGHRVFPYDSLESLTQAPKPGAKGNPILLYSFNSHRREQDDTSRTAWCWSCQKWVDTYRETRTDTILKYMKRNGVTLRFADQVSERTFVRRLENRIEDRRAGGGTLTITKKNKRK